MSIRDHLRAATKSCHQRLDQHMGQLGMFDSIVGYRDYLLCMLAMHQRFADSIRRVADQADLPRRSTSIEDCLIADLRSAGAQDVGVGGASQSASGTADAADWGHAYVAEGSALGGRFLIAAAQEKLPKTLSTHFLACLADDARHRWPRFVAALDAQTEMDREAAIDAAVSVFEFVEQQAETLIQASAKSFAHDSSSHDSSSQ